MASRPSHPLQSSSTSSLAQAPSVRSRRNSNTSLSSQIKKEELAQALDHIHSTASRTDSLTTFNDFAPPPISSTDKDERKYTTQANASGLSSIYTRLIASVSGATETAGVSSQPLKSDDSTSITSAKDANREASIKSAATSSSQAAVSTASLPASVAAPTQGSHDELAHRSESGASSKRPLATPTESSAKEAVRPVLSPKSTKSSSPPVTSTSRSREKSGIVDDAFRSPDNAQSKLNSIALANPVDGVETLSKFPELPVIPLTKQSDLNANLSKDTHHRLADVALAKDARKIPSNAHTGSESLEIVRSPQAQSSATSLRSVNSQHVVSRSSGAKLSRAGSTDGSDTHSERVSLSITDDLEKPVSRNNRTEKRQIGEPPPPNTLIYQMQRKILSRDFWMKDENAKVCFNCGETFTTFRRKHHCRLCGQIYCNSCTSLISGKPFGQASKLRICKICNGMLNDDDSSDYSDDNESVTAHQVRQIRFSDEPRHGSVSPERSSKDKSQELYKNPIPRNDTISSFRRPRETRGSSIIGGGLDRQPPLIRPSSSRSLKSLSTRPRSSSHRSRRPRNQHMRSLSFGLDEGAPFHHGDAGEAKSGQPLPAFHTDSIIDPDLAPFMSDDGSSDDETQSLATTINADVPESPTPGLNGIFNALRKSRPRTPAKGFAENILASRDADNISVTSSKMSNVRRQTMGRTSSFGNLGHYGSSPRVIRSDNLFKSSDDLHAMIERGASMRDLRRHVVHSSTEMESDTARRSYATVSELSKPSLDHLKKLLAQFLRDTKVEHAKKWEKALVPILLRCAGEVDPNIHRGDDIDIRHYVKLKRAPGGIPSDSSYVSGVVFTKNVALKDMPRTIKKPRILLVSFPLIYARHQEHFMSLEGVLAQEREYLRNLSKRIIALRPDVLLVQGEVSGMVTRFLQDSKVTVVYNVKPSVIQAVSRCSQTLVVSSVDKLTMDPGALGNCGSFEVKTFVHQNAKKSYVYISGCQKDLGCTIVLRGADLKTLGKIKWIAEFMCYVAYNSKLETCLLRDQFVSVPSTSESPPSEPTFGSRTSSSLIEDHHRKNNDRRGETNGISDSMVSDDNQPKITEVQKLVPPPDPSAGDSTEPVGAFDATARELQRRLLSVSASVKLAEPYLVRRGRDQELQMSRLRLLQTVQDQNVDTEIREDGPTDSEKFELVQPEMVYGQVQSASRQVREIVRAIHDAEYEKASHSYATVKRRWDTYIAGVVEPFNPLVHQKIVVLFSIVSMPSSDACAGPDLLGLDFYQEHDIEEGCDRDMPLGEYIERLCNQVDSPCTEGRCERKMVDHYRSYVHGEGQVSIFVEKCPSKFKGMDKTILMWSYCRICDHETQVTPMSGDSWKYSFAKYLELSFWSLPLHARVGVCPHDISRDHCRFFGFKNYAVKIQYDPINLVEVTFPRSTITWAVEKDLRLKNDQYQRMEDRVEKYMSSVKLRIKSIKPESIVPGKAEACKAEIEAMTRKAYEEHDAIKAKLQQKYMKSRYYEIIPLNRAVRFLQEKVAEWDATFADFERNYFPSEKDIRKLAAIHLRNAFLDQEQSVPIAHEGFDDVQEKIGTISSPSSKPADEDHPPVEISLDERNEKKLDEAEKRKSVLALETLENLRTDPPFSASNPPADSQVVQNLDLAIGDASIEHVQPSTTLGGNGDNKVDPVQDLSTAFPDLQEETPSIAHSASSAPELQSSHIGDHEHGHNLQVPFAAVTSSPKTPLRRYAPPMYRSQTQPYLSSGGSYGESSESNASAVVPPNKISGSQFAMAAAKASTAAASKSANQQAERLGVGSARTAKAPIHSLIPRAVGGRKLESKVSALAKRFEQMSRELERETLREFSRERTRERRQMADKTRHARAYPVASSKPIVEVFRDANEAVRDREPSYEGFSDAPTETKPAAVPTYEDSERIEEIRLTEDAMPSILPEPPAVERHELYHSDDNTINLSYPPSEAEGAMSDTEHATRTETNQLNEIADSAALSAKETPEFPFEIPKHEKSSLMKMLTSFWSERSASGWKPLHYPLTPTDHVFAYSDIIVREDEPSSLIAFALSSEDYNSKIRKSLYRARETQKGSESITEKQSREKSVDMGKDEANDKSRLGLASGDSINGHEDVDVERTMLGTTASHMRFQLESGSARMQCKVFFAESFDAIRRKCGVSERFVESLSRCLKWDSKGGKTKSLFLKTRDERFVLKSLSPVETQAVLKFAPDYFDYMSKCLFHGLPSALAKMLGVYQVVIKNPATGTDFNWYLQIMENVFYAGPSNRMFDLKGSMRNRKVQSTGDKDEVLLDENLLDYISQSPVYIRNHSNTILASSIQNDTLFCSKQNVMDYSLIVGLYEDRKELLVGIIDYIRTYTWDKKLESWIKDRGKHRATVRSPKEYRTRFRRSIPRYFPLSPSHWQVFGVQRLEQARARLEELDAEEADLQESNAESEESETE